MKQSKIYVVGVGMTKFVKPGSVPNWDYPDMVKESVTQALQDAQLTYEDVEQAFVSYVFGQTCSGQRALYPLGMTGIPIYNVNNACASGSSALHLAQQVLSSGASDCVLVCGFEKMKPGSLDGSADLNDDSVNPLDKHVQVINDTFGFEASPILAQMFGNAAREHMKKYGTKPEHFAKIAWKNHKHSINNGRSQFQKEYSLNEILNSRMVHDPLTKLQCCPTSDGSAAAILCNENFLATKKPHLKRQAVEIVAMTMATDLPTAFNEKSNIKMIGFDAVKKAAEELFSKSKLEPNDVQVLEVHDCFSANELITYEALGLCHPGEAAKIIDRNDNTYGGKWVINPSGGLISKGHPLGATGIAQCAELCWQLRGMAGKRQVPNAKLALQHNIGIGGAVVLALYRLGFPETDVSLQNIPAEFQCDKVFTSIRQLSNEGMKMMVEELAAVINFKITSNNGNIKIWTVDATKIPLSVETRAFSNIIDEFDCEMSACDEDFYKMATGQIRPEQLSKLGRLKSRGNFALVFKLPKFLKMATKSVSAKL